MPRSAVSGLRQHYDASLVKTATARILHTTERKNPRAGREIGNKVSFVHTKSRACDYLTDDLLAAVLRSVTR